MAAVIINNVEYASIKLASLILKLPVDTIRQRLDSTLRKWASWVRKGVEKILKDDRGSRRVRINGVEYPSVNQAAAALGQTVNMVYGRCKSQEESFKYYEFLDVKPTRAHQRVKGVEVVANGRRYKTVKAAAEAEGVHSMTISRRLNNKRNADYYYINARTGAILA